MSAITIPEGFFPPPGVPFETEKQRDLAIELHNSGVLKVQLNNIATWCDEKSWTRGFAPPHHYRIAPPNPRTVGPFESNKEIDEMAVMQAFADACRAARDAGFKRFRIHLTATAEEIL